MSVIIVTEGHISSHRADCRMPMPFFPTFPLSSSNLITDQLRTKTDQMLLRLLVLNRHNS